MLDTPAPPVHALLQVKEVADRLQEKIQLLKSEVKVREKIQKIMRRIQLLLKTEVPGRQTGRLSSCLSVCLSDCVSVLNRLTTVTSNIPRSAEGWTD